MPSLHLSRRSRPPARMLATGFVVVALALGGVAAAAGYTAHGAGLRPIGSESAPPRGVAPTGSGDVRHLDPALHHAFLVAQGDAAAAGIELRITSGWRSHAEQAALFDAAVRKYGSREAASHWVLPPGQSDHERGLAIDVGPAAGAAWLDVHGVHYGLCRRYANEPWHFELLAPALGQQCPAMQPFA